MREFMYQFGNGSATETRMKMCGVRKCGFLANKNSQLAVRVSSGRCSVLSGFIHLGALVLITISLWSTNCAPCNEISIRSYLLLVPSREIGQSFIRTQFLLR